MSGKVRWRYARVLRGSALLAVLCALLLAGGYYVWELRSIASHLADGDPVRGVYQQDPQRADRTASVALDGIVREVPEPPMDGQAFLGGGGSVGRRSEGLRPSDPLEARPAAPEPAIGALFSPGQDGDPDHHCSAAVVHSPGAT